MLPVSLEIQALPYPGHSPHAPPQLCFFTPHLSGASCPFWQGSPCGGIKHGVWRQGMEVKFRENGSCSGGLFGSQSVPCSQLPISCHFLVFPTVVASVFSSLLSLSVLLSLSLSLQPLATLSAFLASLGPPRPPPLPIMPPGPSLALRPRDWVWGASQPGLGALSGRQWCRRPLQLRPSRRA